jgi:cytochrome b
MTDAAAERGDDRAGAVAPPDLWDPLIRLTHWGVALGVLANAALTEAGGTAHVWVGWGVMGLLALRLVWGLVGPAEARFSAFPPAPRAALAHLGALLRGRPKTYASHNPAGAIMAYTLWACLAGVIATGLIMTDARSPLSIAEEKAAVAAGDWSALVKKPESRQDDGFRDAVEEVHGVLANLILFLAAAHVCGVIVEGRAIRRPLVGAMLTGRRRR